MVDVINDIYTVNVDVKVEANGFQQLPIKDFFQRYNRFGARIPRGMKIDFYANTDVPKPYDIWWKVRNVGEYAENNNQVRGEILKGHGRHIREFSQFRGPHFVECYVIKNGECKAIKRVPVNIGDIDIKKLPKSLSFMKKNFF